MLIITNGDGAVFAMQQAGVHAEMLPWRDVLHDGPVPETGSLAALSEIRARFIADCGWGTFADAHRMFALRDERLARVQKEKEVVLWFEHDLYDQLQLLQILDWFDSASRRPSTLSLTCRAVFIAESSYDLLHEAFDARVLVTPDQLALARRAWAAFRAAVPESWGGLLGEDTSALPFLRGAVERLCQEFPAERSGLGRSERTILGVVREGASDRREAFKQLQAREEAKYLGDWSFDRYVDRLMRPPTPLLSSPQGGRSLAVTEAGERALEDAIDWIATAGIDKWIGGVHLRPGAVWRWTGDAFRCDPS